MLLFGNIQYLKLITVTLLIYAALILTQINFDLL